VTRTPYLGAWAEFHRIAATRALGRKASDEFTVALCRTHHREVHRASDERAWRKAADIDPLKVRARKKCASMKGGLPPQ
jgi:hypothetical protein